MMRSCINSLGNSNRLSSAKALNTMQNRPFPFDQTIVELAEPLQIISCSKLPVESDLSAPFARVWIDPKSLEQILILLAQVARHSFEAPDRLRIFTWTSKNQQGPGKVWLRFEADSATAFASAHLTNTSEPTSDDAYPEGIDLFRLRSRIEAIPAQLAELTRSSTCLGVTIVFDLANEAPGNGLREIAQ